MRSGGPAGRRHTFERQIHGLGRTGGEYDRFRLTPYQTRNVLTRHGDRLIRSPSVILGRAGMGVEAGFGIMRRAAPSRK